MPNHERALQHFVEKEITHTLALEIRGGREADKSRDAVKGMCVFVCFHRSDFNHLQSLICLSGPPSKANKQKLIYYLSHLTHIPKPRNAVAHFHFDYTFIKSQFYFVLNFFTLKNPFTFCVGN